MILLLIKSFKSSIRQINPDARYLCSAPACLAPGRGLRHGGAAPHPQRGQSEGAGEGGGQGDPGARHPALPHGDTEKIITSSGELNTVLRNLIFQVVFMTRQ